MKVERFVNNIFTSNSYILHFAGDKSVWVIDPGDSGPIIEWIERKNKYLVGILITHSHFDHIYGINDLFELYPNVKIYASKYAKEGMFSAKLNTSYYTENPFIIKCHNIMVIEEPDKIIISKNKYANVINTPGHNMDCLSFNIGKNLFTGDSLIPGMKVYTKAKNSDKILSANTVIKIFDQFPNATMIWPGHENNILLSSIYYDNEIIKIKQ